MSDDLLRLASSLSIEAGDMVRAGRRAGVVAAETKSSTTDMVTEFDRASEQLLVTRIRATRPHDGIVGEEGSSTVGTSGVSWLIDPIDGTTNFLYDIPAWAVSVAAVDAEGPLAAAVYAPALGELFTARRGGGATLNGVPIACGRSADLSTSLVATGFSYVAARRVEQAARVARMIGHVRDVRRFGAASLDLCFVAMGRLDGYFEEDLGPWDLAAGQLVATEAGCRTGDFSGGAIRPGQALVANPSLFADLADLIERSSG